MVCRAETNKGKNKMKKLIVAACAVVSAIALNAASVSWQATKGALYDGADTPAKLTAGEAYLVFVTSTYTQDSIVEAFATANGDKAATLTAMGTSVATGTAAIDAGTSRPAGTSTYSLTADGTAYFVVFNGDKMYVSATTDVTYDALTTEGSALFSTSLSSSSKTTFQAADGYSAAGWYAVPEPTSGLLMLLGMAGLALRRKRA